MQLTLLTLIFLISVTAKISLVQGWPVFPALDWDFVQYFSNHFTWKCTVKNHDCLFSCLQNYGYSTFYCLQYFLMFTVLFNVFSAVYMKFYCLHEISLFTWNFTVYMKFYCLHEILLFTWNFTVYMKFYCKEMFTWNFHISQTFHSYRLLSYSLLLNNHLL